MGEANNKILHQRLHIVSLLNYSILSSNLISILTTLVLILVFVSGLNSVEFDDFVILMMY